MAIEVFVALTPAQRFIVEWGDGPLVVIAGAGTGPASRRDDIARFASTLEAVADGVGWADYEPTGLLGTRACSYCPDRASRGPYRRLREAVQ